MVTSVNLKPDLAEQIAILAGKTDTEDFIDKALRAYLAQYSREKIRLETKAYNRQREQLLIKYLNEYVAIHDGHVIDHDPDLRTLHLRVFDQLGNIPVLLKQVINEPEREMVFRSPRFERGVS